VPVLVQTAHDQGYLVKHLLSGLPNVTERVKAMRAGRAHLNAEDRKSEMIASQEAYIKALLAIYSPHSMSQKCRTFALLQVPLPCMHVQSFHAALGSQGELACMPSCCGPALA
jgi:hypothetical protein